MSHYPHCEYCGNEVNDPYWIALFMLHYSIFLDSPHVESVDRQRQEVTLRTGQVVEFLFQVSENIAIMPQAGMVHLLCSESCEDSLMAKNSVFLSESFKQKSAIMNYQEMNAFKCVSSPLHQFQMEERTCECCGMKYADFPSTGGRRWMSFEILDQAKDDIVFEAPTPFDMNRFDQVLTAVNDQNPRGPAFAYKLGKEGSPHSFCTYDCALVHAKQNQVMFVQKSILEHDRLGLLSPHAEIINANLGNRNPSRPSFMVI